MKTGTLVIPPEHNPVRENFQFEGWTLDDQPYDFQTPILQDMTLTAKWAKTTDWTLSPNHGPATGAQLTVSPPDKQEPYYTSIHAAGDQIADLTGDGRIYTWTQDSTPMQVPFPAQAPDGFHYLQVTTSSQSQAALGSDQHIYTWTNQQATPTILDTSQNTRFTSINLNDNRLLAVDQQGQVHTFQAGQTDSNDLNAKPVEQATTSLPSQTQAVLAIASSGQILAQDTDGRIWTWEATNTSSIKPERINQDPSMRITQATALSSGFLLLDADGQVQYLADSATKPTAVSLPDGQKASRITTNKNQAMITSKDGHVWAWQPGKAPVRADNGNHYYTQAISIGSKITTLDRQGSMSMWSLDAQDKPIRLNTTQTPILETASMDSQPMRLSKEDGSWQIKLPTHNPGTATITITGRQDGQAFTRNLKYTVDQTLLRDAKQDSIPTVTFNTAGGGQAPKPQQISYPYGRAKRPSPDPMRKSYQFDGWFIGDVAYDFSKPVTEDLALTAHWTPNTQNNTWRINPDRGSQLGNETTTITPPDTSQGIRFSQVSGSKSYGYTSYGFSLAVGSDGNAYAWGNNSDGQLGNGTRTSQTTPVRVKTPDRNTYPDLPEDFTYVQVSAGGEYSLALGSDGYIYAWGNNKYGQLGNNTRTNSPVPVRVRDPNSPTDTNKGLKVTQVSGGGEHALAVGSDGYAYAWGRSNSGQLGNNGTRNSPVPVRVRDPNSPTDTNKGLKVTQVSGGGEHALAVGSDGYAYAWGRSNSGQLGNNGTRNSPVPVRVRDPNSPTDTNKGLKVTQVSGGGEHALAVGSDGYAYAWGRSNSGQLGNNGTRNSPVPVRVRDPNSPTDTNKGLKVTQVSGGGEHALAVGSDGYAYAWGRSNSGQLGNNGTRNSPVPVRVRDPNSPTDTNKGLKVTQVSGGGEHALAVGSDGYAYAWGRSNSGQLGNNGTRNSPVPVRVRDPNSPTDTNKGLKVTQVSGGGEHALAVGSDGYAYAWGRSNSGQLGNNGTRNSPVPVRVRDPNSPTDTNKGLKVTQVSGGGEHALAVGSDGYAYAWGRSNSGQLGNNGTRNSPVPVRVRDPNSPTDTNKGLKVTQVSGGGEHSLALGSDGYAYAWGANTFGWLGNNSYMDSAFPVRVRDPSSPNDTSKGLKAVQVSAGDDHSLAVGTDGYAYAWGYNGSGQLGINIIDSFSNSPFPVHVRDPARPTDASEGLKATQVSGGFNHSLALGSDGYAYAWGDNSNGQLGKNTTSNAPVPVRVRDPDNPSDESKGLKTTQVSGGGDHSLAVGSDGNAWAWGSNSNGQLGNNSIPTGGRSLVPVPVSFNLQLVITGVRFDQTPVSGLTRGDGNSVTVFTPAHQPGMVTVSVDYTLGGAPQTPDTSLRYTYLPAGVLPRAGGEGILLALATGMTGMGGVLASRRHRREQHQLSHASHE
nr:InlB B-repeat-containing protein [Bifidobacterium sp. wkB344]